MRYLRFNRLAFRSSEELDEEGAFEFFTYDPIGRPAVSGLCYQSINNISDTVSTTVRYVTDYSGIYNSGYEVDDDLFNLIDDGKATQINYYDSYDCLSIAAFDSLRVQMPAIDMSCAPGNLIATRTGIYSCTGDSVELSDPDNSLYALYSYDTEGRVVAAAETSDMNGSRTLLSNTYTRQGYKASTNYSVITSDAVYCVSNRVTYDPLGNPTQRTDRLTKSADLNKLQQLMNMQGTDYSYDMLGRLERTTTGNHQIDYGYNLRGQLTSIQSPFFSQSLKYETGSSPCYNGNISEMTMAYGSNSPITRKYTYDRMNRLTAMTSTDGFNTAYTYNLNSSPLTIQRYGLTSDGTVGLIDDLSMTYSANRLTQVVDYADPVILENSLDFDKSSRNYTYDLDGRLYSDGTVTQAIYTPSGHPLYLGTDDSRVRYRYSAAGVKLSSGVSPQIQQGGGFEDFGRNELSGGRQPLDSTKLIVPPIPFIKITERYYVEPMEFESSSSGGKLTRVNMPWGYIDGSGQSHYYVADYQGNIRVVFDHDGNVEQSTDYYPYGMPMAPSTGAEVNRYKYSGKELETHNGLNFYDFEARLQFPAINFMNQPDVNAADYTWLNPYLYCAANPINIIDPTGQDISITTQDGVFQWREVDGKWGLYDSNNNIYSGNDNAVKSLISSLTTLMDKPAGKGLVTTIANDERSVVINPSARKSGADNNDVGWRPDGIRSDGSKENVPTTKGPDCNPTMTLAHELAHVLFNWTNGSSKTWLTAEQIDYKYNLVSHDLSISEIYTTHMENLIRAEHDLPLRTHYFINPFDKGTGPELIKNSKFGTYSIYYDSNSQTNYKPLKSKVTPYYYIKK